MTRVVPFVRASARHVLSLWVACSFPVISFFFLLTVDCDATLHQQLHCGRCTAAALSLRCAPMYSHDDLYLLWLMSFKLEF